MIEKKVLPALIALHFDLSSTNLWTTVLCLTYNIFKNLWSDFIALGFFTVTYWLGDIGLLLVNSSGFETINDSRIDLYYC